MSDKKKFYQKWWFWVIVAVVVLGAIGSATRDKNDQGGNDPDTNKPSTTTQYSTKVSSVTTTQATTTAKQYTAIGETIQSKSVKLTVESFGVLISENEFAQPEDGKEFVEAVLLLESIETKDNVYISALDVDAFVDGFATDIDAWASIESEFDSLGGTIAPGKKMRGSLCYSLPIGWSELELQIEIDWVTGEKITLLLKNEGQ